MSRDNSHIIIITKNKQTKNENTANTNLVQTSQINLGQKSRQGSRKS